jgi:hypothetical protein
VVAIVNLNSCPTGSYLLVSAEGSLKDGHVIDAFHEYRHQGGGNSSV